MEHGFDLVMSLNIWHLKVELAVKLVYNLSSVRDYMSFELVYVFCVVETGQLYKEGNMCWKG